MKTRRIICLFLVFSMIATFLCGCQEKSDINWTMQASIVTEDGQVTDTTELSIKGKIYKNKDNADSLELTFSSSFDSKYSLYENEYRSISGSGDTFPYYVCSSNCYESDPSKYFIFNFALDEKKGWVIFLRTDDPDTYLVGSIDGTDPKEIMAHFQLFINAHRRK